MFGIKSKSPGFSSWAFFVVILTNERFYLLFVGFLVLGKILCLYSEK
ncbi:hypothetical protein FEM21_32280 [Flavobacterium seoulense]|uniref:Uncharacterized protein n=1 Tax=Flavobacterium seoulense TaxID=1492738 RepID=A0A066WM29_9FLAO|nr:hypothetical protein FEM21_32280 [Flavobacterium seoulense]